MDILDQIKDSLEVNNNLNDDFKTKLFELSIIFHNKFPDLSLDRLVDKLKTVKIGRISKYEKRGVYVYDVSKNEILFSPNKLSDNYDLDHLFMKAILEMTTSTNKYTGFKSDNRLRALNAAYTEILANYIIGNEGVSDLEEEMLITNLISYLIGKDTLFNAYFTNDGNTLLRKIAETEMEVAL